MNRLLGFFCVACLGYLLGLGLASWSEQPTPVPPAQNALQATEKKTNFQPLAVLREIPRPQPEETPAREQAVLLTGSSLEEIASQPNQSAAVQKLSAASATVAKIPSSEELELQREQRRLEREREWALAVQKRDLRGDLLEIQTLLTSKRRELREFEEQIPILLAAFESKLEGEYVVRTEIDYLGRYTSVVEPRYTDAEIAALVQEEEQGYLEQLIAKQEIVAEMAEEEGSVRQRYNDLLVVISEERQR